MMPCLAIAFALLLWPAAAAGQGVPCWPAESVEQHLKHAYGESRVSVAISNSGQLIERWESESGTWTLLLRERKNGRWYLCAIVAGHTWREVPPELTGTRAAA